MHFKTSLSGLLLLSLLANAVKKPYIEVDWKKLDPVTEGMDENYPSSTSSSPVSHDWRMDPRFITYEEALKQPFGVSKEHKPSPTKALQRTDAFKEPPQVVFQKGKSLESIARDAMANSRRAQLTPENAILQHNNIVRQALTYLKEVGELKIKSLWAAWHLAIIGGPITPKENWQIIMDEDPENGAAVADTSVYHETVIALESRWNDLYSYIGVLNKHEELLEQGLHFKQADITMNLRDMIYTALQWITTQKIDDDAFDVAQRIVVKDEDRIDREVSEIEKEIADVQKKLDDMKKACKRVSFVI